ncbi:TetR family transcriptional regulator C-terminal domain-containing protein [Stigmatella sp. ncwal1]|uniref:TetR family transcriptional regulator C-terminal domain-containing protein n=1 Tax=Stigmatella ashevillensis TaxID=2995309 RepID=A0ABT5DLG8_9BACT|nr:TetR/AcrR family transcriptional regulator [Stigmatella ashevillena]MDC0714507.1 TetR family transcriptional regulator C-terminal domain-containing protein [Stigmatella ashevillena]
MARASVREQIVVAGMKTLLQQGFNGCGVQDITSAAGVPKGSFYNHFESKEALGVEVVERYWRSSNSRLSLLRDSSIVPLERLRRCFTSQVEALIEWNYERGCLLGNLAAEMSDHSQLIRERVAVAFAEWSRELEKVIQQAQAAGEISASMAPAALAVFLINAWEGAVLRSRVDRSRAALDAFMSITFDKVLT